MDNLSPGTYYFVVTAYNSAGVESALSNMVSKIIPGDSPPPTLTLSTDNASVDFNGMATLTWSSNDAISCSASGDWSGSRGTAGMESVGPLTQDSVFTLECTGEGGSINQSVAIAVASPLPPSMAMSAEPAAVEYHGASTLSWSSEHATSCVASGDWSGSRDVAGTQAMGPLTQDSVFTLECTGAGGSVSETVTITVASPPQPSITLSAEPATVAYQGMSTLSWFAENATSCTASGGWSGSKLVEGGESVGPLTEDTSFVLSCTGEGGEASASTIIAVNELGDNTATLTWTPPTSNEDGSPLGDLVGYKIYYGTSPGSYPNVIDVANSGITEYVVESLSPDTYYFVMTAYNSSGGESVPSNMASKLIE